MSGSDRFVPQAPAGRFDGVELIRVSRYHDGRGNWGDQMVPTIREAKKEG